MQVRDRVSELRATINWLHADLILYAFIKERATRTDPLLILKINNIISEKMACIHELNTILEQLAEEGYDMSLLLNDICKADMLYNITRGSNNVIGLDSHGY